LDWMPLVPSKFLFVTLVVHALSKQQKVLKCLLMHLWSIYHFPLSFSSGAHGRCIMVSDCKLSDMTDIPHYEF
jgi:hypothetical protein